MTQNEQLVLKRLLLTSCLLLCLAKKRNCPPSKDQLPRPSSLHHRLSPDNTRNRPPYRNIFFFIRHREASESLQKLCEFEVLALDWCICLTYVRASIGLLVSEMASRLVRLTITRSGGRSSLPSSGQQCLDASYTTSSSRNANQTGVQRSLYTD